MNASPPKTRRLDVRSILTRGEEPFPVIRRVVDALRPGERLELTAPFLPSPLIEKLGSEGFQSAIQSAGAGVWTILFWRSSE